MAMPMAVTAKLNMRHAVMACRSTLRAAASSLAPTLWAACTENPVVTAEQMPQKSQRLVDTSPIAAESSAPPSHHRRVDILHENARQLREHCRERQHHGELQLLAEAHRGSFSYLRYIGHDLWRV